MNRAFIFIVSVLIFAQTSLSQESVSAEQIALEIQSFYQHPSSALLAKILLSVDSSRSFLNEASSYPPYVAFLTEAFSRYPSEFELPSMTIDRLQRTKGIVLRALDLSQTKDALLNLQGHTPERNDIMWGGFFASGDTRYLDTLISELRYCARKDSFDLYATGESAKWSLASNSRNYPEVRQHLENVASTAASELRPHIKDILHSSTKESGKRPPGKTKKE